MNDDASLYAKSNTYQRTVTKKVLDEFGSLLNWRADGRDSVLDIGCGSGDVTVELVLPILPARFRRLIACDLSDRMIKYARQQYIHPKVVYEQLDIRDPVDDFLQKFGQFDHIVSFYCLHWVRNHKEAFSNIRKLLTPDGDCLLMFLTSTNTFTVYDEMSKTEKWSHYMQDVELYIPAHHYIPDPVDDFQQLCQSAGFSYSNVQAQEHTYICKNYEEYKSMPFFANSHV